MRALRPDARQAGILLGIGLGTVLGLVGTLLLFWSTQSPAVAPEPETNEQLKQQVLERISEARTRFLVDELALEPSHAQQLEAMLAEQDLRRFEAHRSLRDARLALSQVDELDHAQVQQRIDALFAATRARDELRYFAFQAELTFLSPQERARVALHLPNFEKRVEKRLSQAREKRQGEGRRKRGRR